MPVFESTVDDELGFWASVPTPKTVSFGVENVSAPVGELLYRVNLPADATDSEQVFNSNTAAMQRIEAALSEVPARLDGLVTRTHANLERQSDGLSFDVLAGSDENELEGELLLQLADVDMGASGKKAAGAVSYGIGETVSEAWGEAKNRFDALISQIDRDVLHFAWVETAQANELIARTSVDWSGDAQTVWQAGCSDVQLGLHQRNLRFVTQTRALRMRLFVTVASGAARVASLMATPGGAVLALPAVYQYVSKILAQARELQGIQSI